MDHIKVLITGAGAPGIRGTLYSLSSNFDGRKVTTIGVDMNDDVIGKYLCDRFYKVPRAKDEGFISALLDICERERVDVILPQVTGELLSIAASKRALEETGARVALSDPHAIEFANNKCRLLSVANEMNDLCPSFYSVKGWGELEKAAGHLGFPFVIKPPESNGMRGFRIVYDRIDRKREFYEEKPDNSVVTMEELYSILGESFPELLVMEYLPGPEYSVDILSDDESVLAVVPRKRDQIRSGITFKGSVEKREDIIASSVRLTKKIGLRFAHGLQYKENGNGVPMLIESNPRVQGTMVLSTVAGANVIYGAVKLALGESIPTFDIKWDARLLRYWGGVGIGRMVVEI
jgi:carbamoyl-phosphate synthase large subunit